uniref:Helitron_like_N domain-containing protein n=1 Tax=Strongyloides venezuelensis TaxID=75913 RepID=A0A0K0G663_STRVS
MLLIKCDRKLFASGQGHYQKFMNGMNIYLGVRKIVVYDRERNMDNSPSMPYHAHLHISSYQYYNRYTNDDGMKIK